MYFIWWWPFHYFERLYKMCRSLQVNLKNYSLHCKKRLSFFPFPDGMSLTKVSLAGNNLIIPGQGEFDLLTSRLGMGKSLTCFTVQLFNSVIYLRKLRWNQRPLLLIIKHLLFLNLSGAYTVEVVLQSPVSSHPPLRFIYQSADTPFFPVSPAPIYYPL